MIVAGIDIGTLTCRLLIVDIARDGSWQEIDSDRRILRLGEGVDHGGVLSPQSMTRVVEALGEWQIRMAACQVEATVAVATSAVRQAKNRKEFLAWVKKQTGLQIEVLSGEEEARRTLLGIEFGLPVEITKYVGLDIGGGSTEFIKASEGKQSVIASLDLGVVRLTERSFHSDPPSTQEIVAAERFIREEIQTIQQTFGDLAIATLVGTAGTVTTLAAMAQQLPCYESAHIHNYWLSLEKIYELEKELSLRTGEERAQLPGLEAGREGVIVAGTIILRTVMETLGFKQCLVSDYGLREGILVDLIKRKIV